MELLRIPKLPIEAARFVGRHLLGGAWAELPPLLPTRPTRVPTRPASIQYYSTGPETSENVVRGDEWEVGGRPGDGGPA